MMLEAAQYGDNAFITLTYSDENLPPDLSVRPAVSSGFVKRLRFNSKRKFRYFAVGEYGDESGRPHYHLALFGFPACFYGRTRHHIPVCCSACEEVKKAWTVDGNTFGRTESGLLTQHSMAYVAGYINKKMTRDSDPRLEGRRPEFARMSRRPGLGYGILHDLASEVMAYGLDTMADVPAMLDHGRNRLPLGRYLRRSLRKLIGRSPNAPEEALKEWSKKMQPLREAAFADSVSLKSKVLEASLGRRIQIENRARIFKGSKKL